MASILGRLSDGDPKFKRKTKKQNCIQRSLTKVLTLISILMSPHLVNGQGQLLGSLSVDQNQVSALTTLRFDLTLTAITVASYDYLEVTLPEDQDSYFQNYRSQCTVENASVSTCNFINTQLLRISFNRRMTTPSIIGSITYFVNPRSTKGISNVRVGLYSQSGQQRSTPFIGSIFQLTAASLTGSLSSSSKVIGDKNAILQINVDPQTVMTSTGRLIVNFPYYYEASGSDQMIGTSYPVCSGDSLIISSCQFNLASRILTIEYQTIDNADRRAMQTFTIRQFKNPVKSGTVTGFFLQTTDAEGYTIGESPPLSLSGVTLPTGFKDVSFSFDDNKVVGQYSNFRISISMESSLGPGCYVRIVFPSDFVTDYQLQTVSGTGWLQPRSGSRINLFENNYSTRSFAFEACRNNWGLDPSGSVVFQKVKNPEYIRETGSFEIQVASDGSFRDMIAVQVSGLTVTPDQLKGGLVNMVSVVPADYSINTATSYTFNFAPVSSIDSRTEAKIEIEIPNSLEFTRSSCSILNRSSQFSNQMSCNLDQRKIILSYIFSNKPSYQGDTPLSVTISEIRNANYAGDVGAFKISTYIKRSNVWYLQDESTVYNRVTLKQGLIYKVSEITSNDYTANKVDAIYTFELKTQSIVPVNGRIRVNLPDNMSMRGSQVQNNCYRLNYAQNSLRMDCVANESQNYFDVFIKSSTFGTDGLPANQVFKLQVSGMTNPKEINVPAAFTIESFDDSERLIDKSGASQGFTITMKGVGSLGSIQVIPKSLQNGATTTYGFQVTPNLAISAGDSLIMMFPAEVQLPMQYYVQCDSGSQVAINSCIKSGDRELKVTLGRISSGYRIDTPFDILVRNVVNPVSFRPSSPFSQIKLVSRYGNEIAKFYDARMVIQTNERSEISDFNLSQSSLSAGQEATYTISFQPEGRLPSTAAFKIKTPRQIEIVRARYNDCYIESNRIIKGVCNYDGTDTLMVEKGLNHMKGADYFGAITIVFKAVNPPSNFFKGIEIQVEISLDESFKWPIASIDGGLKPSFECNYPCISCNPNDPSDCESCPEGARERQFLQENKFTGKKTCMEQCDLGYTWDAQVAKVCLPCDPSCQTCRQGGQEEDRRMCNSCAMGYPYLWLDEAKCFAENLGCPQGAYEYTRNRCSACMDNCAVCNSATDCLRCDTQSSTPLLQNEGCVSRCQVGKTPIYDNNFGQCVNCKEPCATCQEGNPSFCLTCADGEKQFLFGGQCLPDCPEGTTRDLDTSQCIGCRQGCRECDLKDNSICLRCDTGLALYKKQCLTECPQDFQKSNDGSVCEVRIYPFDSSFVPFPFLIMLGGLYIIGIFCWILTRQKTLLLQVMIIFTAFVLQLTILFELLKSIAEGQALFITMNIFILICNTLLSVAFSVTFHIQIDDHDFEIWRGKKKRAYKVQRIIFTFFSMHFFRLIYSKIFSVQAFAAAATVPHDFVRPLHLYSKLFILIVLLPVLILNIFGMASTYEEALWDNQLQMTMFESVLIVPIFVALLILEMYKTDPRSLLHKPTDESPFFISLFKEDESATELESSQKSPPKRKISFSNIVKTKVTVPQRIIKSLKTSKISEQDQGAQGNQLEQGRSFWEITDIKIRHAQLAKIIRTVKSMADLKLNNQLDLLIDQKVDGDNDGIEAIWEIESCPDLSHGKEKACPENDYNCLNTSFPGLNQDVDPMAKRMELMAFFQKMAEDDAERERLEEELILRQKMHIDAACMHDTELIDNCFFTSRQKVTAQAQTVAIELVEQALSAKTIVMPSATTLSRFGDAVKGPSRHNSNSDLDLEGTKSVFIKGNKKIDSDLDLDEQTARDELQSERHLLGKAGQKERMADLLGDEFAENDLINSGDEAINDVLNQIDSEKDRKKFKLKNQLAIDLPLDVPFESSAMSSSGRIRSNDPNMRKTPKPADKRKSRKLVPNESDSNTLSRASKSSRAMREESKNEEESFMDDVIRQTLDGEESEAERSSITVSTQKRGKDREKKVFKDYRQDLSIYRKEPVRPVNSRKWLANRDKMATILRDAEEVAVKLEEPYEGMNLKENYGRSEPTTERTISQQESLKVSEKDRINGGVSEESYAEDDALFYKNNYPYDTHESISSVATDEHEKLSKIDARKDFTTWMRQSVVLNQRSFNENEVLGNFPRDEAGRIISRLEVIRQRNYRDFDGQLVNECGYLINEVSGAIRSKYTYEDILIGEYGNPGDIGQLPMPFRLERYNFNPHKIQGSFDYCDKTNKPFFLRNKFNVLTDKLFRPVNKQGFLINEREDVIDDEGRVRFIHAQLLPAGGLRQLYTYKGEAFSIKDIIGQFKKDDSSKEILLQTDPQTGKTVDMKGRLVNANGYLIDKHGNIIKYFSAQHTKIMFNFWEIMFQEPPKIFDFTEFDLKWIKGNLNHDVTKNPRHDDEFDLDGRMINSLGYLIDIQGNVVDQFGKMVFRKDILSNAYGQDAKIPDVFTKRGLLTKPLRHDMDYTPMSDDNVIVGQNDFSKAHKSVNQTGSRVHDETNVGSNAPIDFSKSGDISGVFSDMGLPNKGNQSSIQMSNMSATEEQKGERMGKMVIEELQQTPSQIQLNININGKDMAEGLAGLAGNVGPQKKRVKTAKKHKQQDFNNGQAPVRPGTKVLQNFYANYIDGPTDITADQSQQAQTNSRKPPKLKKVGPSSKRPIRSAVRNSRPHQTQGPSIGQGGRLLSPASEQNLAGRPQVIMQGYMGNGSGGNNQYVQRAEEEIFTKSNKKAQKLTQKMMRNQEQSFSQQNQNMSMQNMSLNQSGSALLNNQLAQANNLYQNHRQQ